MGIATVAEIRFREIRFRPLTKPDAGVIEKIRNAMIPSSDFNVDIENPVQPLGLSIPYNQYNFGFDLCPATTLTSGTGGILFHSIFNPVPRISYRSYPVDIDGDGKPDISVGIQAHYTKYDLEPGGSGGLHYTKLLEFKFLRRNCQKSVPDLAFVSVSATHGGRICIEGKCGETLGMPGAGIPNTGHVYSGLRLAVGDFNGDGLTDFATVLMDKGLFLLFPEIHEVTAYLQEPSPKK